MINVLIIGANGYVGVELVTYLYKHSHVKIIALVVSESSLDIGKLISDIYPKLKGIIDLPLQICRDEFFHNLDAVFLATNCNISHNLVPKFLNLGCVVLDLSAAFRVNEINFYSKYYNFKHLYSNLLKKATYGLAEWEFNKIKKAQLIAIPGCYPTVIQLALKPIISKKLINIKYLPVVNAISGVSGAGRLAKSNTSFCEVSLTAYGIFNHCHYKEITNYLGISIIFNPHLCNFSRGIFTTITCLLKDKINYKNILDTYNYYYNNKPLLRIYHKNLPELKNVVGLPFCDIGFKLKNKYLVIIAIEDNLLKGAATQAIQCFNIRFGFHETKSIII